MRPPRSASPIPKSDACPQAPRASPRQVKVQKQGARSNSINPNTHRQHQRRNHVAKRLTVLYLPHPSPKLHDPWDADVANAIGDRHEFRVLDKSKPIPPQFKNIDVVIDMGGAVGTREMVDTT